MDYVKISELNEVTNLTNTDVIPVVNNGETKKATILSLLNKVGGTYAEKDTDATTGNLAKFDASGNPIDTGYATNNILGLSYTVVSTWT